MEKFIAAVMDARAISVISVLIKKDRCVRAAIRDVWRLLISQFMLIPAYVPALSGRIQRNVQHHKKMRIFMTP